MKGNNGNISSGNTIPRCVPSQYWCFTDFGEMEIWKSLFEANNIKYIIGKETCPSTGKKHLQGYIESPIKIRPKEKFKSENTHWEKRKGTREQNIKYCSKEGVYITNFPEEKKLIIINQLYEWQQDLVDALPMQNDRQIFWVYDNDGCSGKTALCKYFVVKYNALVLSGKASDIKFGVSDFIKEKKDDLLFIFHFVRSQENFVSYQAIEEIKDGLFYSTKYESKMVIYNPPKVVIFANFRPDTNMLSRDRWIIHRI